MLLGILDKKMVMVVSGCLLFSVVVVVAVDLVVDVSCWEDGTKKW